MRPAGNSILTTKTGEIGSSGWRSMNSLTDTDGRNAGRVNFRRAMTMFPGRASRSTSRTGPSSGSASVTRRLTRRSETGSVNAPFAPAKSAKRFNRCSCSRARRSIVSSDAPGVRFARHRVLALRRRSPAPRTQSVSLPHQLTEGPFDRAAPHRFLECP